MTEPEDFLSRAEPVPTDPALDAKVRRAMAGRGSRPLPWLLGALALTLGAVLLWPRTGPPAPLPPPPPPPARAGVHVLSGPGGSLIGLALSPDGASLAVCSARPGAPAEIAFWDPRTGERRSAHPLEGSPGDLCWLADGSLWATDLPGRGVLRIDPGKPGARIPLDAADARLFPSPDGTRVLVAGFNAGKAVYALPAWTLERRLEGPTDLRPTGGGWSADGRRFVASTLGEAVVEWDLSTGESRVCGEGRESVFGPDGRPWAVTPDLQAFGPAEAKGDARRRFSLDGTALRSARFSPDGRRLALGAADGSVAVKEAVSGRTLAAFPHAGASADAVSLVWAPDGAWVAVGRADGSAAILRMP